MSASSSSGVFRRCWTSFEDKVHGGDELQIEVQHTAMVKGRMHLEIQAYRRDTNARVLRAEAEVEQAAATYIFCGQGSQEKGMGMSTYESDAAVRDVWDRGDRHLRELYGRLN
jgi:fatty acid synthase subunit beta, fungi type